MSQKNKNKNNNNKEKKNEAKNQNELISNKEKKKKEKIQNEKNQNEMVSNKELQQHQKGAEDLTHAASALFRIPVFFSHQGLFSLGNGKPPFSKEQLFVIEMFKEIKKVLLFPRTLPTTDQYPDTTIENVRTLVNSSYGLAAVLLTPKQPTEQGEPYSPFLQIEPSMAFQRGLPILLVIQESMTKKASGVWSGQFFPFTPVVWHTSQSVEEFFNSVEWKEVLQHWAGQVMSGYFAQTGPEFEYKFDHHE